MGRKNNNIYIIYIYAKNKCQDKILDTYFYCDRIIHGLALLHERRNKND